LYLQKRKIDKNKMEFKILLTEVPVKAGIDPYNKLIDRTPDNNVRSFTNKAGVKDAEEGVTVVTIGG